MKRSINDSQRPIRAVPAVLQLSLKFTSRSPNSTVPPPPAHTALGVTATLMSHSGIIIKILRGSKLLCKLNPRPPGKNTNMKQLTRMYASRTLLIWNSWQECVYAGHCWYETADKKVCEQDTGDMKQLTRMCVCRTLLIWNSWQECVYAGHCWYETVDKNVCMQDTADMKQLTRMCVCRTLPIWNSWQECV